jgi:hypothetical protein
VIAAIRGAVWSAVHSGFAMLGSDIPQPPVVDGGRIDAGAVSVVLSLCVREAPDRAQDSGLLPSVL